MASAGLPDLHGRCENCLSGRDGTGNRLLGDQRGQAAAAHIFHILAYFGAYSAFSYETGQKNIENLKNFICIWRKMGYNKVE
jgi:hypothetical protein